MRKIVSFSLVRKPDYDVDFSHVGTFDNEAKSPFAIEHKSNDPHSYNWFNPQPGTCETKKDAKRMYDYMMKIENGEITFSSIHAVAEIQTSPDGVVWLINTLRSGGIYGVEDGLDQETLREMESEEEDNLFDALLALGFTREEIEAAEHSDATVKA